jgi:hypothetical protein
LDFFPDVVFEMAVCLREDTVTFLSEDSELAAGETGLDFGGNA